MAQSQSQRNHRKMFRSIAGVLIVALSLHQAAFAIDVSQDKNVRVEFTSNDAVQQTKSVSDLETVVQPAKLCQVQAHSISATLLVHVFKTFPFIAIDEIILLGLLNSNI